MQESLNQFDLMINEENDNQFQQSTSCLISTEYISFPKGDLKIDKQGQCTSLQTGKCFQTVQIKKSDIKLLGYLGKGTSGYVQEAIYLPIQYPVAVKSVNVLDRDKRHQLLNDLKIQIKRENIIDNLIQFYGAFYDEKEGTIKIVLELMDLGSLRQIIKALQYKKNVDQIEHEALINEQLLRNIAKQAYKRFYQDYKFCILNIIKFIEILNQKIFYQINQELLNQLILEQAKIQKKPRLWLIHLQALCFICKFSIIFSLQMIIKGVLKEQVDKNMDIVVIYGVLAQFQLNQLQENFLTIFQIQSLKMLIQFQIRPHQIYQAKMANLVNNFATLLKYAQIKIINKEIVPQIYQYLLSFQYIILYKKHIWFNNLTASNQEVSEWAQSLLNNYNFKNQQNSKKFRNNSNSIDIE